MPISSKSGVCIPLLLAALGVLPATNVAATEQSPSAHDHQHQATGHEAHGAHVHGLGQLMLASDGESLELMMELTAADVLGFEHAPATDAEKQSWQRVQQQLKAGRWLSLPAEVSCQLTGHEFADPWAGGKGGHSDIQLTLKLQCQRLSALQQVDFKALFSLVPGLEQLSVQWVHQGTQGAATLKPSASLLQLSGGR